MHRAWRPRNRLELQLTDGHTSKAFLQPRQNNVLIGVYVSWILTGLSLGLPASRVIDLCTEETFQLLCLKMAKVHSVWTKHIAESLATSLDRRIPALLFRGGLDLYPKAQYDPLAEAYYTAAFWCAVEPRIRMQRARTAV